jgi:hypothetical protein
MRKHGARARYGIITPATNTPHYAAENESLKAAINAVNLLPS